MPDRLCYVPLSAVGACRQTVTVTVQVEIDVQVRWTDGDPDTREPEGWVVSEYKEPDLDDAVQAAVDRKMEGVRP